MTFILEAQELGMNMEGRWLFRNVDLQVAAASVLAITGPNGTGKTTLLRVLHKLVAPTVGEVRYLKTGLRVGMVFQKPMMLATTVLNNVAYPLKASGQLPAARRERALSLLKGMGAAHLADRVATTLSGGEQQRVAMIRALASDPELLLLDEPTAHLDSRATAEFEQWIASLKNRVAMVMVSHDAAQVERVADAELCLKQELSAGELFSEGQHLSTGAGAVLLRTR